MSSTVLNYKNMVVQKTLYTVFIIVFISTFIIETEGILFFFFFKLRKEYVLCPEEYFWGTGFQDSLKKKRY